MAQRSTSASVFTAACPSRENLCLLTNKWSLLILRALQGRTLRFTDLHHRVGGISQKMLAQTLRQLEHKSLIARRVYPDIPYRIEYYLRSSAQA